MLRWMQRMGTRLSAITLLALLVRALIPAGYMIAEADTGSGRYLTLKVCDGHQGAPTLVNLDTGEQVSLDSLPKKLKSDSSKTPCVFAAPAAAIEPVAVAEPVRFATEVDADVAIVRDLRPGRGIAAPPPPATGPPSLI